jgi:CBS domain-containing protein
LRSAINVLLQRKISSIPVVDNTTGCITGVLTKQDVVRLLTKLQSTNYLDVLSMTVHDAMTDAVPAVICRPTNTISEAIEMIMADDVEQRQCAFVVDDEGRPIAAVALIDLMDYV